MWNRILKRVQMNLFTRQEQTHRYQKQTYGYLGFPGGLDGKESAWNTGDTGLIPRLGSSSGEENGNRLQYSCLDHGIEKNWTWLND